MDTNAITQIAYAISQAQPRPALNWEILVAAIAAFFVALAGLIKVYTMERSQKSTNDLMGVVHEKVEAATVKADAATVKADANARVVDTILVDVNSSKDKATDKAGSQEALVLTLSQENATLKEKLRVCEMHNAQQHLLPVHLLAIEGAVTKALAKATAVPPKAS